MSKRGWSEKGSKNNGGVGGSEEDEETEAQSIPNCFKRLPKVQMLFFLCVFARSSLAKKKKIALFFFSFFSSCEGFVVIFVTEAWWFNLSTSISDEE